MNSGKRKFRLSCFGIIVHLLSCLCSVDGVVLCLGQDGHVKLENAAPDLSCKVSLPGRGAGDIASVLTGLVDPCPCGPCKDIPLSLVPPEADIPPTQSASTKTRFVATSGQQLLAPAIYEATPKEPTQPSTKYHPLVALRTVVLLI